MNSFLLCLSSNFLFSRHIFYSVCAMRALFFPYSNGGEDILMYTLFIYMAIIITGDGWENIRTSSSSSVFFSFSVGVVVVAIIIIVKGNNQYRNKIITV